MFGYKLVEGAFVKAARPREARRAVSHGPAIEGLEEPAEDRRRCGSH